MASHDPMLKNFTTRPILLDGGMGRELQFRGVQLSRQIWSASALTEAPDMVRTVHEDYIRAGADIITTNTYGLIRENLAKAGLEDRYEDLNAIAGRLARQACATADRPVLVAGSLPPLRGSFRPDRVGPASKLISCYREQARILAPFVDFFLCETMSSAVEGSAAAAGALEAGKPVWVSWTLHEDHSGRLRSGETIEEAVHALEGLKVTGCLVNCSAPDSITKAIPLLAETAEDRIIGGYANTFFPIPENWQLDGSQETDGLLSLRNDLDPEAYAQYAVQWIRDGAAVVGGCCGTRPAHIKKIFDIISGEGN
ncbi:homocysteine S-methyltransferase family protein [uncultured Desulfosarcina sp.]|uniref:homocysteine S-methyltransferase family protein n=1 Tax=uncultured Desulfosarcina sp. TaxID=218289 RepID=UPI0029C865F2|nr:homocysteine S-methyltransferase family protein [uncultured Desulfosarcina sp.]